MSIRTLLLTLAALLAAPACAAERDFDTGETSVDDSGDPYAHDEETAKDEPVPDEEGGGDDEMAPPDLLLACELEFPCEHPLELVRGADGQTYADSDLCAFKALAGGGSGLGSGLIQALASFPSSEAYLDHVVVGPGEVLRQAHGRSDGLGLWQKPVERCTLQDPAFFVACAQQFDADCLDPERWVTGCEALGSLTCPRP